MSRKAFGNSVAVKPFGPCTQELGHEVPPLLLRLAEEEGEGGTFNITQSDRGRFPHPGETNQDSTVSVGITFLPSGLATPHKNQRHGGVANLGALGGKPPPAIQRCKGRTVGDGMHRSSKARTTAKIPYMPKANWHSTKRSTKHWAKTPYMMPMQGAAQA